MDSQAIVEKLDELIAAIKAGQPELLDAESVAKLLGIGLSTFRELERGDETFPDPAQVCDERKLIRWRRADVMNWIKNRPLRSRRQRLRAK